MGTNRKISYTAVVLILLSLVIGFFSFSLEVISATTRDIGWGIAIALALLAVVLSVLNKR